MYFLTFISAAALLFLASPTNAQSQAQTPQEQTQQAIREVSSTAEEANQGNIEQRRILARQIHELRPIDRQVADALNYIGADLSPQEQAMFRQSIMANMDMDQLQESSIIAMAQVFTVPELSAMAEYYNKPESSSIEEKSSRYRARIDPQIAAEINDSLSRLQSALADNTTPQPAPLRP